ncbi:SixA phosphatase family protein [Roseateles sp. BYS87W]|uniref:SixA phosphatase family protein n=1 Tax=Pelomonas baiyunensis TaxID=3299026 RepID=A0ABW7H350_9BURK
MKPLSDTALARALTLACATLALLAAPAARALPDLVVLVRHAEKATDPASDPGLSDAGQQRAQALADAVRGLRINAVITTQYQRTRATAAPVVQALGLTPQVVETRRGDLPGHVQAVADAVREHTGAVLVVGHSNTVPALLAALGGPRLPDLCETSFQHVFVLQPGGTAPRWAHWTYGAPSGAPEAQCQ